MELVVVRRGRLPHKATSHNRNRQHCQCQRGDQTPPSQNSCEHTSDTLLYSVSILLPLLALSDECAARQPTCYAYTYYGYLSSRLIRLTITDMCCRDIHPTSPPHKRDRARLHCLPVQT